jgi:peptide/nickel transport system substrate-binding protein
LEATYRGDKANFFAMPYWTDAFIGSGPFRVKQWVPDSFVVIGAYDQYVLGRPKIDEIEVGFIPDPNTLMVNLLADGQLTLGRALSLAQALQVEQQWQTGHVNTRPYGWLPLNPQFINPDPAVVANLQFRRAVFESLDRQQLVESLQAGRTAVADSWVDPNLPEHAAIAPSIVRYPYDPQAAIRAITDLGYARQADGFFYDARNQKLSVQIQTTAQNAMHEPASAAIADAWQRIGVAVSVDIVPPQRAQDREYRATFPSFELIELATDLSPRMVNRWHSRQTPSPQNRFLVTGNGSRYQNPALDGAIDRYLTTIPRDARLQALAEMIHIQTDQLSAMGLIHTVTPTLVDNRLQHVTGKGTRSTESWNAQEWELVS